MKSFSERKGLKPVRDAIQTDSMNDELRNSLWNGLHIAIWDADGFVHSRYGAMPEIDAFSEHLWFRYFRKPIDARPGFQYGDRSQRILKVIRDYFFDAKWHEVYDFLEFVVGVLQRSKPRLVEFLNDILVLQHASLET